MSLVEKYQSVLDLAASYCGDSFSYEDEGGVLHVRGTLTRNEDLQALEEQASALNPDGDNDLALEVEVQADDFYDVQSGDTLARIAKRVPGLTWQVIFEANRDQLSDPNSIFVGQRLRIPRGGDQ
jgi:nucleoid-associated protein YgaU